MPNVILDSGKTSAPFSMEDMPKLIGFVGVTPENPFRFRREKSVHTDELHSEDWRFVVILVIALTMGYWFYIAINRCYSRSHVRPFVQYGTSSTSDMGCQIYKVPTCCGGKQYATIRNLIIFIASLNKASSKEFFQKKIKERKAAQAAKKEKTTTPNV
ncbi:hypothetical protein CFD26_108978 [Aspergillus turcosus]|uniref:Uncharacterized protein n=1 Tax=Aspergillus turcosus TaxID=1245748 RepID=A0A3R7IKT6_9EURO|nr:hypothetical protein CFD26_108978 [Aspergillus turcosus]